MKSLSRISELAPRARNVSGQQVEEQRAVVAASRASSGARAIAESRELVQRLQVRRLPAQRGAVVNELDGQLSGGEIELQGSLF